MNNIKRAAQSLIPFHSKGMKFGQGIPSRQSIANSKFINEAVDQWPRWTKKEQVKQKKEKGVSQKGYKNGVSYQLNEQIPKIIQVSRSLSYSYDYYVDKQHKLVYFYPNHSVFHYNQLTTKPVEKDLITSYNSPAHYQSIKVVPFDSITCKPIPHFLKDKLNA